MSTTSTDTQSWVELYAPDAVVEVPQFGERFEGLAAILRWRRERPGDVRYLVRHTDVRGTSVVQRISVSYRGGPWQSGMRVINTAEGVITHERVYVFADWAAAPDWSGR